MKHLMLDIESFGNHTTGAIVSVAAQFFCTKTETLGPFVDLRFDLDSCLSYGLTVNRSCLEWWLTQSEHARKSVIDGFKYDLPTGLHLLSTFIKENRKSKFNLWSHTFDTTLLNHAYEKTGERMAWHFRECRDIRTLHMVHRNMGFHSNLNNTPREGAHDALCDVRYQIDYVRKMLIDIKSITK